MKAPARRRVIIISAMIIAGGLVVGTWWFTQSRFNIVPSLVASGQLPQTTVAFPEVSLTEANDMQRTIVALLKQEYSAQPKGTKYSGGVEESWCADFVSWIMKEAGTPLSNPNNGGWRIPGTYTLREYYQSVGKFQKAGSNYTPKPGDVVLYDNPSPHGQHTNVVIKNENGLITTVGGNEGGKIRIQTHELRKDPGLVGYGVL